ncbi:DUF3783 domain-containing protein [Desulfonema magnum]|uniref:DUF3783 n=1 Tax=Desulfonema magnum TaxID=45655 RepID=A0A975BKK0_9BACT|nr:DUF3783 domain-containing protein [Desulfonema magnum]QTA87424.1 DUF3783 [Desulfonema magnum]
MRKGTFKKVGDSTEAMYGPRAILVCGFTPSEQKTVIELLDTIHLADVPIIFATDTDTEIRLGKLLTLPSRSGRDTDCDIARAIIMSGITERELQKILSTYKDTGLPRPLWATLTPFSENWTLSSLLKELKKERAAMEERNK